MLAAEPTRGDGRQNASLSPLRVRRLRRSLQSGMHVLHPPPEPRPVVGLVEVGQLVDDDVVDQLGRLRDQLPVEAHRQGAVVAHAPSPFAQVADDDGGGSGADQRHVARDGVVDVLARPRLVPGDDLGARVAVERAVDLQHVAADGHGLRRPVGELQPVLPAEVGEQLAGDDLPGLGRRPERLELGELAAHPGQLLAHDGLEPARGGARRRGEDELAVALDGDADGPPPGAPAHGEAQVVHREGLDRGAAQTHDRHPSARVTGARPPARRDGGRPPPQLRSGGVRSKGGPETGPPLLRLRLFRAARPYGRCSPASCRSGLR